MGERLLCKQEVIGSIPFTSTTLCAGAKSVAPQPAGRRRTGGEAEISTHEPEFDLAFVF